MNRFQKILWTTNGVLILITFLAILIILGKEFVEYLSRPDYVQVVQKDYDKTNANGLKPQRLSYDSPVRIRGSDNFILLVSSKKERIFLDEEYDDENGNLVNVIFLDKNLKFISALTDKPTYIRSIRYPSLDSDGILSDTVQRCITYRIVNTDTDGDGELGDGDITDLYISEFDGRNFHQIGKDISVLGYEFINRNEILIRFTTTDDIPEEYREVRLAKYSVNENRFEELTSVSDTLKKIEATLTK